MKTRIMLLGIFLFFSFFQSCSKKTEEEVKKNIDTASQKLGRELDTVVNKLATKDTLFDNAKVTKVEAAKLPKSDFRKKLNDIFDEYDDIREELCDDDSAGVNKQAAELKKVLSKTQMDTTTEKLGSKWKTLVSSIEKIAAQLEAANDLQKQRTLFADLSISIEDMVKNFGTYDRTVYKLKCTTPPSKSWLTDSKKADNPYFGEDKANEKSVPCAQIIEAWEFD